MRWSWFYIPYNVLHEIDNGAFPAAEIAKANGFYSLSKNQFNEAMKLLGKHANVGWRVRISLYQAHLHRQWRWLVPKSGFITMMMSEQSTHLSIMVRGSISQQTLMACSEA